MLRSASNARILVVLGLAIAALTACGGSQQSLPSPTLPTAGSGPSAAGGSSGGASFARVKLVIKVPRKAAPSSAARRRPHYVSPSIASVTVSVTAPGSPSTSVTSNVVCSAAVPPACTVTASILAPVEKEDTFTVISYDGANATGNVLSQGSTVFPVDAGTTEQIPIVLQGIAASIVAVTVANPNPFTGTAATSSVSVSAADADGNVIVGPYQTPVTLQIFENDSEGSFSFAQGGAIVATGTVAGSATPATIYLKAKSDTTTPDDATLVATIAGAPYVPGTSATPALSTLGEITTACPATSPQCVFYPSGAQILANTTVNNWEQFPVLPGTTADPGGASSIWSVPTDLAAINVFDTANGVFANVTENLPPVDVSADIAGSFWGAGFDPNSSALEDVHFSTNGTVLQTFPLTTTAAQQGLTQIPAVAEAFDSTGQFWAIDGGYIYAVNPSTGASTACSFQSTDANFANSVVGVLAVAGNVVWLGINGAADGNTYLFKVPVSITASGCNLSTLETASNKFELTSLAGAFDVNQILVDAGGDAYALQVSSVWKVTQGGQATKIIDTGTALTQIFAGGTLDPTAATLYLVDPQSGLLYKTSAAGPNPNPLPSIVLPAVLGIIGNYPSAPLYDPFFQPDGTLWLAPSPFANTAIPFSVLGSSGGASGGLVNIRLAHATFAARAGASPKTREVLLRLLRSHRRLTHGRLRSGRVR